MPGKVNPVIPEVVMQVAAQVIGNDTAITIGGMQGNFELNVRDPADRPQPARVDPLLTSAATVLDEKCVRGIEANRAGTTRSAESTLAVATALNPYIGYDRATEIVQEATRSGRSLREVAREAGRQRGRSSTRRSTCARWRSAEAESPPSRRFVTFLERSAG